MLGKALVDVLARYDNASVMSRSRDGLAHHLLRINEIG